MLANAVKRYGDRIVGTLIGAIIATAVTYLVSVYVMVPDLSDRMDGHAVAMDRINRGSILRDSMATEELKRIFALLARHDKYFNGGDGTPGLRIEIAEHDRAILDIRDEIDYLRRNTGTAARGRRGR